MSFADHQNRLLLVEDDEISREILSLQIAAQGYQVAVAESGDQAVTYLQRSQAELPHTILTDLHMPGLSGRELAHQLRAAIPADRSPRTALLAMSATQPDPALIRAFDGFLLKPFTMPRLVAAIAHAHEAAPSGVSLPQPEAAQPDPASTLNDAVYRNLADAMPAAQLRQLYTLFLNDAESRIDRMRSAAADGDDTSYRKQAHAIKGGCSMVGAVELHKLATAAEGNGIAAANHVASLSEMLASCERLRRILNAREDRAAL